MNPELQEIFDDLIPAVQETREAEAALELARENHRKATGAESLLRDLVSKHAQLGKERVFFYQQKVIIMSATGYVSIRDPEL